MKCHKQIRFLLTFLILFFSFFYTGKIFAIDNNIKVGVYENNPKVYTNPDGNISGLYPDILNYISKQEQWQIDYVHGTWEEGLSRLKNGDIDLMVDVAISDERRMEFDFTNETVINSWGVVCVHKDSHINSFPDLEGKKIAVLKSSIYLGGVDGIDQYLKSFGINTEFFFVDEYIQAYELLNDGKVDAVVVSRIFSLINSKNYPNIKHSSIFFKPTELRFALTKGNVDNQYLIEKLDVWIKKIKSEPNGIYNQTLKKYGLEGAIETKHIIPEWVYSLILILIILIIVLFVMNYLIRRSRLSAIKNLHEGEKRFHSLYEAMDEMIAVIKVVRDKNGKIVDYLIIECNSTYAKIVGVPKEKIIGKLASKVFRDYDLPNLPEVNKVIETGKPLHFETFSSRNNKTFTVSVFLSGPDIFGIIASDITDRKKTELELKAEHDKFQLYLENVETIIVVLDRNGIITTINRKGYELLGYNKNELIGKSWFETCLSQPEGKEKIYPVFLELIAGKGKNVEYYENYIVTRGGKKLKIAWHNSLLRDEKDQITGTLSSGEDITFREQTEESLRQSEEKFSNVFQTSPNAITISSLDNGKFLDVNDAYQSLTGYTKAETIGNTSINLKIWADPKDREQIVSDIKAGKLVSSREVKFRKKNGEISPGLYSAQIVQINNQPYLLSSIVNISELKNTQLMLKESEQKLFSIFNNSPIPKFVIDTNHKVIYWSKTLEKLSGFTSKEIVGSDQHWKSFYKAKRPCLADLLVDGKIDQIKKLYPYKVEKSKLIEDSYEGTGFFPDLGKSGKWLFFSASLIKDTQDKIIGSEETIEDITERKQLEQTIIEDKLKSEAILESIGDAVFAVDKNGLILLFNKIAEKITGVSAKNAVGKKYSKIISFLKESSEKPDNSFINEAIIKNKITKTVGNALIINKYGLKIPVDDSAAPIKNAKGEIIGCVVVFRDVTKERQIDKAKTEFVSIVSHELRAPLGIIKAFNSMIFDGDYGPVNSRLKEPLIDIKNSTDNLINLVNDILSISRIEAGKMSFTILKFNTKNLIINTISKFKSTLNGKVTINYGDLVDDFVKADVDKFLMVLNNLISNAIKFTNQGQITISSKSEGNFINFSIADTGVGINPSDQKNLFSKFNQITTSETGKPPGTGLGLYISQTMLQKMGGKIWLESSTVGKGSTFVFSLPKAKIIVKEK